MSPGLHDALVEVSGAPKVRGHVVDENRHDIRLLSVVLVELVNCLPEVSPTVPCTGR